MTMEKNITTFQSGMKWGVYIGVVTIFFDLLLYVAGMKDPYNPSKLGYLVFLFVVVGFVLAIKFYKDNNEGFLSLGEAISTALYTALIASAISIVYFLIFVYIIDPQFLEETKDFARESALQQGNIDEETYESMEGMFNFFVSPIFLSLFTLISNLILGLITGLITGLVMKNENTKL